jgi:hypothetical protein
MFHHVLASALGTVFDLAFAILPAAPLFALKGLPPSPVDEPAPSAISKDPAALNTEKA